MPLDLLVSDLLLPQDAPAPLRAVRLPALEKWLARADMETDDARSTTAWLAARFGLSAGVPVAAISLAGEGESAVEGAWLRADPVHLRIDPHHVTLHDASVLAVTREEASALVAALQAHFAADGLAFHAVAPDRWYVGLPERMLPKTTPLEDAFGRDVSALLPASGGSFNWRSALTEAQMVMAAHPVNAEREAARRPTINSVWLWGEGALPAAARQPYALVHAGDAFARGLGEWSGAEVRNLPDGIAGIETVRDDESALAVIGGLTPALRRGDQATWRSMAEDLDERWFAPLGEAIARLRRVRLVLPAETGTRVATLTAAARWRWYRARKPLAAQVSR